MDIKRTILPENVSPKMRTLGRLFFTKCFSLGVLATVTLGIALDGNHYWHDIRFLYASSQFSFQEILSGAFNPHQLGGMIDEVSAGGFYLAKVLHIWLLQILYRYFPPVEGGFAISVWLSIVCMGLSTFVTYHIFLRLFKNKRQAWLVVCCFLVSPVTPYLAGKILSEVTALFLIAISIWAFAARLDSTKLTSISLTIVSGIFLLMATLARLDILLCFMGFFVALVINTERKGDRINLLKCGSVISAIFVVGYFGTIYCLGMGLEALTRYFRSFTGAGVKSNIMSIMGILTFGGVVYGLSFGAIFNKERKKVRLLTTWLFLSAGSAILITCSYMVEPRYLVHALLPLAGLGALGLDVLWQKIKHLHYKEIIIAALVITTFVFNVVVVRLMPYELNRPSILKAVNQILEMDKESIILTPWAYTDFHFLRVMKPNLSIYNVNSPTRNGQLLPIEKAWQERLEDWYGEAYVDTPTMLDQILAEGSVYYLGWRKYPPAENAMKIAQLFGIESISGLIDRLPLKNHLAESWVWHYPDYNLELVEKCGQYEYYKVTARKL